MGYWKNFMIEAENAEPEYHARLRRIRRRYGKTAVRLLRAIEEREVAALGALAGFLEAVGAPGADECRGFLGVKYAREEVAWVLAVRVLRREKKAA